MEVFYHTEVRIRPVGDVEDFFPNYRVEVVVRVTIDSHKYPGWFVWGGSYFGKGVIVVYAKNLKDDVV